MPKSNPLPDYPTQPVALSIRATMAITGLGRSSVYVLLGQKRLLALHYGRRVLVLKSSIDEFLASLPEAKFKVPSRGRPRVTSIPKKPEALS